ncbi:hypothetical protein BaRGS_00025989 [Batillaria attramentaria]|uniref:Uncharacterized protein n=1 Tax=Batillaria attramentaria TaxID=370345 RepID=A0ABD0K6S0_9CAEN
MDERPSDATVEDDPAGRRRIMPRTKLVFLRQKSNLSPGCFRDGRSQHKSFKFRAAAASVARRQITVQEIVKVYQKDKSPAKPPQLSANTIECGGRILQIDQLAEVCFRSKGGRREMDGRGWVEGFRRGGWGEGGRGRNSCSQVHNPSLLPFPMPVLFGVLTLRPDWEGGGAR